MQEAHETSKGNRHEGKNRVHGLPSGVIWDLTYACPLRCVHCYSESGRRPPRQLGAAEFMKVADAIIAMKAKALFLSGGEPLIVKELPTAIERWAAASIAVYLFTSGWKLDAAKVAEIVPLLAATHVSVDGFTAEVHDRIRQRPGSFERAMSALEALDAASAARRAAHKRPLQFGIECTLIQSNFHQLEAVITEFPKRFQELSFINVGAAVPSGVASTPEFAQNELLTEQQLAVLRRGVPKAFASGKVLVSFSDQRHLQMRPDDVTKGIAQVDIMQLEPDGKVRAMAIYEGTVGNVLSDPPEVLWQRVQERWRDPFVVQALSAARTRVEWAAATRAIDQRFGDSEEQDRIARRLRVVT